MAFWSGLSLSTPAPVSRPAVGHTLAEEAHTCRTGVLESNSRAKAGQRQVVRHMADFVKVSCAEPRKKDRRI